MNPPEVGFYTCGPTVYNYAHIGNYRAFVFEDLLRRWLTYRGYRVRHVMNITDVEDKIIRTVHETGESLAEVTGRYTDAFLADLEALNVLRPDIMPRATETIDDMIRLIQVLVDKQHAYVGEDGSVYFSIASYPEYGQLARLDRENLRSGVRVAHDEYDKENAADFALWKAWVEADGEVKWDSPWGPGRPGWHIECSCMSMKHLGETFDIHCGGEDLVFPHHEDEIAQSQAATGKPFVRYWLHNAHLLVEGRKMSKSLGNFYTLRDLIDKGWTGREVRYVLIGAHYREQLNFTMDGLQGARTALQRIDEFLLKLMGLAGDIGTPATVSADLQALESKIQDSLDDDLNISPALGAVFDFVRDTNKRLATDRVSAGEAGSILEFWRRLDAVLGFGMPSAVTVPAEVRQLVDDRQAARKAKDFARADEIRDRLTADGWVIEDTPDGPKAKRAG
jgi:cysteinyl-tRNA synthetase